MTRPPRTSKRVQRKPATQSFSASRLSIGLIPTLIGTSARTSLIEPAVPSTRSVLSPGETATPLRLAFAHPLGRGRNPIRLSSHKNLPHGANSADRGRSGAGLGDTLDAAPRSTWLGAANREADSSYPPVFPASMLMNSALRGQSLRNSPHTSLASPFFLNRFCRV